MNELNGDQRGQIFTSHLIRDILRQVQETNRYVRHYTSNIHFQNGPKNLNKNRKDNDEREDINKKKVLKNLPIFQPTLFDGNDIWPDAHLLLWLANI